MYRQQRPSSTTPLLHILYVEVNLNVEVSQEGDTQMIRFRPRRDAEPKQAPRPPARVCVDGQPAIEQSRDDQFVTVIREDGSTYTTLVSRVSPCTCDGSGCK